MPVLSAMLSSGNREALAHAPAFTIAADGTVHAVSTGGERKPLLIFKTGMTEIGRSDIKDGAWYHRRRKLHKICIKPAYAEEDQPLEFYGDGVRLTGPRRSGVTLVELGSMEPSLPYLWSVQGEAMGEAIAEVHDGIWAEALTDEWSFSCREIMILGSDQLPPEWVVKPGRRLRPAALAG